MKQTKRMSLGTFPEISLREARVLRDEARVLVAKGVNPRTHRKRTREAVNLAGENTFKVVFERWHTHRSLSLRKGRQTALSQVERVFAKDVLPKLGHRSIYEIKRQDLLEVLGSIERHGVRTSELRWATPDQFHLDQGLWIIPPDVVKQLQTKMRRERIRQQDFPPYIVPLPVQAQEIVRHLLNEFQAGQIRLVPSDWSLRKPLSENTLNQALHRIGFRNRLTGHGIRATIHGSQRDRLPKNLD